VHYAVHGDALAARRIQNVIAVDVGSVSLSGRVVTAAALLLLGVVLGGRDPY
jgi:hypothetical protein